MQDAGPNLQDEDESVRIAVRVLGDMKNSFQQQPVASTSDTSPQFVTRVAHHPILNTALRAYEQGKASSRVVKYGAEMMESSVKTVPNWVQAHSPFVGAAPNPPPELTSSPTSSRRSPSEERQVAQRSRWQAVLLEAGGLSAAISDESMRRLQYCLQWLQYATQHIDAQILILRDFTASLQPLLTPSENGNAHSPISHAHLRTLAAIRRDIVQTIRQVVDVVSRYAGGALPEPARTRVRGFILKLPQRWARKAGGGSARDEDGERDRDRDRERDRESVAAAAAGGTMPVRRGRRAGHRERGAGGGSPSSSRTTSPISRYPRQQDDIVEREPVTANSAIVTAQRILTLATESLDMTRGVTSVVKDSLDRADAWVGRLRTVGIQRAGTQQPSGDQQSSPTTRSRNRKGSVSTESQLRLDLNRHRRVESSSSSLSDDIEGSRSPYSGTSSFSSYASGSSIPSTPGVGHTYLPTYGYPKGDAAGGGGGGGGYLESAPSPGIVGLGLSAMSLEGSAYSTPRSMVRGLPDEDEEGEGVHMERAKRMRRGDVPVQQLQQQHEGSKTANGGGVRIVGMDMDVGGNVGEDRVGAGRMEIDT